MVVTSGSDGNDEEVEVLRFDRWYFRGWAMIEEEVEAEVEAEAEAGTEAEVEIKAEAEEAEAEAEVEVSVVVTVAFALSSRGDTRTGDFVLANLRLRAMANTYCAISAITKHPIHAYLRFTAKIQDFYNIPNTSCTDIDSPTTPDTLLSRASSLLSLTCPLTWFQYRLALMDPPGDL